MKDLEGKNALVTGAAKRIGREIALGLARSGANVAITYRSSRDEARKTRAEIAGCGVRALAVSCDVRSEPSVAAAVGRVVRQFGSLDLLVNNAALYETVPIQEITVAQWDAMFATNVRGPFLVARAALPALQRSRGRIINIGSLGGVRPWIEHAHYCASKASLHMLTAVMAKAWAPQVAVNCVAPGMIHAAHAEPSAFMRRVAAKTPMRRAGAAADVVDAVLFLATATTFITGQILVVDGGLGISTI